MAKKIEAFHGTTNLRRILHVGAVWCPCLVMSSGIEVTYKTSLNQYNQIVKKFSELVKQSPATMRKITGHLEKSPSLEEIADHLLGHGLKNSAYDREFENDRMSYKELGRNIHVFLGSYEVAKRYMNYSTKKKEIEAILGFSLPTKIVRKSRGTTPMVLKQVDLKYLISVHVFPEEIEKAREVLQAYGCDAIQLKEIFKQ